MSVLASPVTPPSTFIVALDLDWTVIRTRSGKTFPNSAEDWELWDAAVGPKLQEAHRQGAKVVFFTNQGGVESGKQTLTSLQSKLEAIIQALGIPVQVLNPFPPKPRPHELPPGTWKHVGDFAGHQASPQLHRTTLAPSALTSYRPTFVCITKGRRSPAEMRLLMVMRLYR